MTLDLTALELRILGALIEKQITTPEYYPLTLNALVAACNQKNNRNPVMQLTADEVARALATLQYDRQLVGTYSSAGSRAVKYTHRLTETIGVDSPEGAILCELMLRGPQTPGELRGRAARMHPFASPAEVKIALDSLMARQPDPYVAELPRQPGCKENRFAHCFGDTPIQDPGAPPDSAPPPPGPAATDTPPQDETRLQALEERIARLEARLEAWAERASG